MAKRKAKDIVKFTTKFWAMIGERIVRALSRRTFERGTDIRGKKFKKYSTIGGKYSYRSYKARGMTRISDGKKLKAFEGQRTDRTVGRVNLKLTGQFANQLVRGRTTKRGVVYGWDSRGEIVDFQKAQGRDIFGSSSQFFGMSKKEIKIWAVGMERFLEKNIKKWESEKITLRIGK